MKRKIYFLSYFLLLGCIMPGNAFAYLDPGTGSMLVSALIGIFATLFFMLRSYYYKVVNLFYAIAGRSVPQSAGAIVFYCEGRQYWPTFKPVLEAFEAKGLNAVYLASDEKDPALARKWQHITTRHIGMGNKGFAILNMLEADICVMTTPGLDVLQIHRSPGVKHYAYISHSITDIAIYRLYSFDYFDSFMCAGQQQIRSLRHLEALRNTPEKLLLETGCCYMDLQAENLAERQKAGKPGTESTQSAEQSLEQNTAQSAEQGAGPRILVAPTWGGNGLFSRFGAALLLPLAKAGYHITLRPHPQSFIVEKNVIDDLHKALDNYPNVVWDKEPSPFESMYNSDVLISDLSGIVFDYAFIMERPVITVKFNPDLRGLEASDLPWAAWELDILPELGAQLTPENINTLPQVLAKLPPKDEFVNKMRNLRAKSLYNYQNSGNIAAEQLMQIKQSLQQSGAGQSSAAPKSLK